MHLNALPDVSNKLLITLAKAKRQSSVENALSRQAAKVRFAGVIGQDTLERASTHRKVIIIGSGPAGWTAAIYAARANLKPLVIQGNQPGGQLTTTTLVENFPGFPKGVDGPELMQNMEEQARHFGTDVLYDWVTSVDLSKRPFTVQTGDGKTYTADSLIVATGASPRKLGLASEEKLLGRGVSTCATCDGFFFKEKNVAVVGGGDSAMEEALYLSNLAKKVTIIHRKDEFRASQYMQDRVMEKVADGKIEILWDSAVEDIEGTDTVTGLKIKNVKTGLTQTIPMDGVFIAIGHLPNTDLFKGQLDLDAHGYIVKTGPVDSVSTSVPGVFVAGDVADSKYRQAVVAAGDGSKAAIDVERFLNAQQKQNKPGDSKNDGPKVPLLRFA